MRRSILVAALATGALAGAAGAAVNAQEPAPPTAVATPTATPVGVPVDGDRKVGQDAKGRYMPGWVQYRVRRSKIAVRADDPAGGLPWAVRVFDAERLNPKRLSRSLAGARVIGRNRCVLLGRVQGDRFGWVYGDGRFRDLGIEGQLLECTSRKRPRKSAKMASILAIADPAAPKITSTVVWGLLPGASSASVAGSGAADGAAVTRDGVFLRVAGRDAHPAGASVSGGGHTVRFGPRGFPRRLAPRLRFPTVIAGTQRVVAPAPDPAGGPRWGIQVAESREGPPCVSGPTRVVEDRGGAVDLRLALFTEGAISGTACRPLSTKPSAERPCDIGWGFGNAEEIEGGDAFNERARVERRLLAGRANVWAQCAENVERVTLRTPRDVRTLVPSAVGRAILAVYDGDFVDGQLEFVAHLRGGRRWTEKLQLGGF